jgi:hypothetical protein
VRKAWILLFFWACAGLAQVKDCAALTGFTLPGVPLEMLRAEVLPAGSSQTRPGPPGQAGPALPAHCRVEGVINRRVGAGGKEYGIHFALAMPDSWNGRFLFQGGGGLNGTVQPPLGGVAAGDAPALLRGFAVVSTDTGHRGAAFDGSFFADQQAALDFHYAANGRVTEVAKQIIARYYGRPPEKSYFTGCSTGGREGMIMSQRYPSYFDGIISGAPAMVTGHSNLALAFIDSVFSQGGKKSSELLSQSDRKLVVEALLAACDSLDGIKDGMIFHTRGCKFDPATLTCPGPKTEGCLSREQAEALKIAFAGPKTSRGRQVYPGFPFDPGIGDSTGLPGLLFGPRIPVAVDRPAKFDVDQMTERVESDFNARLGDSTWTNLSTFSARGGKLIFFHGMADPWFSPLATVGYYERLMADNGGRASVEQWSRLFLVPGMGHCGGGSATLDRFDMLTAIVDWVEKGQAPEAIVATGRAFPGRSRPLCPYPQYAHYKGAGDPNDAASFVCKE